VHVSCQRIWTHEIKLKTKKLLLHKYDLLNHYSSPFNILQLHLKHLNHLISVVFFFHYNTKSSKKNLHITLFFKLYFIYFHRHFLKTLNFIFFAFHDIFSQIANYKAQHLPFNVIIKKCKIFQIMLMINRIIYIPDYNTTPKTIQWMDAKM
jgi:hypothetical protein